jgi:hypothetical protein
MNKIFLLDLNGSPSTNQMRLMELENILNSGYEVINSCPAPISVTGQLHSFNVGSIVYILRKKSE